MTHPYLLATRRTALAVAVTGFLLSACQLHGGGRVDQLNDLRGPTQDFRVELREGTNMAAAPSPDGERIVFSAQGALWVIPAAGGTATRITAANVEVVIKNGRAYTLAEILAPFSTPAALAARRDALAAYRARCGSHPSECAEDGQHAD
jgi:hypothetical protein